MNNFQIEKILNDSVDSRILYCYSDRITDSFRNLNLYLSVKPEGTCYPQHPFSLPGQKEGTYNPEHVIRNYLGESFSQEYWEKREGKRYLVVAYLKSPEEDFTDTEFIDQIIS